VNQGRHSRLLNRARGVFFDIQHKPIFSRRAKRRQSSVGLRFPTANSEAMLALFRRRCRIMRLDAPAAITAEVFAMQESSRFEKQVSQSASRKTCVANVLGVWDMEFGT
jgi:hypothetical protein